MQDYLPFHAKRLRMQRQLRYFYLSAAQWRRQVPVWIAAILIGLVAYVFALGSHWSHDLFFKAYDASPYWSLLITPAGLALAIWIMQRFFPGSAGGGIPQSIAALEPGMEKLREYCFTLRAAVGKIVLTLIGIGSGATFGYEGPIVQVGAAIKYSLNRKAAQRHEGAARSFILAGAAAGVAAAFNAPLAGIMFAIEEMGRIFDMRAGSTILLSVIVAGLTTFAINGNYSYFGVVHVAMESKQAWLAVPLCGVIGGIIGGLACRLMLRLSKRLPGPLHGWRGRYPIRFAAGCGLALAVIGILGDGSTFGTGYFRARDIIEGHGAGLQDYGVLKLITMFISHISAVPGGMFAPSLAVGAGFGLNMSQLLPFLPQAMVVLLGMVGFFAGMTRAPMTGFVIVMEMTDSSAMLIPLMATALLAASVSRLVTRRALYEGQVKLFLPQWRARMEQIDQSTSRT
ncbi:chloride channel protein [Chromobacterium sp. IIBBL 290-4]|uniref:chloride channel protein n=1 Tax=Chromobacterium sp. IIBBL 290-4 TaxID=2953890 RepID=UPI0020B7AC19|nr:chloride channel protein [Chromobacterium sp. IIBBL 290-4]UTH72477.1 chloride channel protein [Chromobacterium sp. IIBBL 290-4]